MATNYPILTPDSITWSKEALEAINAIKETPFIITDIAITMDTAKEAVNNLIKSLLYESEEEFLNSDDFINNPENQRKVIEWVLYKWILWKE